MKKLSPNAPCPCGSGLKYKRCCRPFHRGKIAPDALTLMKSRYSAYAAGEAAYIMATTHPSHPNRQKDPALWKEEILLFCRQTEFLGLEILAYRSRGTEATVHFTARLSHGDLGECSHFLYEGEWLYYRALDPSRDCTSQISAPIQ
ncbi:YchJ family protein [Nitratifractor sp.]